jgi:hypothetical protein
MSTNTLPSFAETLLGRWLGFLPLPCGHNRRLPQTLYAWHLHSTQRDTACQAEGTACGTVSTVICNKQAEMRGPTCHSQLVSSCPVAAMRLHPSIHVPGVGTLFGQTISS